MNKYRNTKLTYQGIEFDSKLELYTYQIFKDAGFDIKRTTESFVLQDGFSVYDLEKGKIKRYQPITYKDDFYIEFPDKMLRIECKGFSSKDYPLRKKLFLSKYGGVYNFVQIKNQAHCLKILEKVKAYALGVAYLDRAKEEG